jgi:tetratricopeptide (TPR) repeat protein
MTPHLAHVLFLLLAQAASPSVGRQAKTPPTSARPSTPAPHAEAGPPVVGPKEKARAKVLLDQASRLYDRHEYAQALEKFNAAYDIYPSPNLLYNIGQTYQDLARPVDALETFERFLKVTDNDPTRAVQQQRGEVHTSMESLKNKVGRLQIDCPIAGAEIRIDGKRIGTSPLPAPVWVTPGSHQLSATLAEGYFPELQNVSVAPGEYRPSVLEPRPIPPPPPAEPPPPTPAEIAAEHDRKAKLLYEAGNYTGAIAEMEAEYVINADPNVLFNIGQSYRLAQQPQQAVQAYRRYLERLPQAQNRPQVEALITNLENATRPSPPQAQPGPAGPGQAYYPQAPGGYAPYPSAPYGAAPQPGYPRPGYPAPDTRPLVMDYDSDKPIPPGYQLESNSRRGLVVTGAIIFGISYGIALGVASSTTESSTSTPSTSSSSSSSNQVPYKSSSLYIPVLGPWLALDSVRTKTCSKSSSSYQSCTNDNNTANAWKAALIVGGATQALGFGFVVLGLAVRSHQLVLDTEHVRASVLPVWMGNSGQGLAMVGSFSGL